MQSQLFRQSNGWRNLNYESATNSRNNKTKDGDERRCIHNKMQKRNNDQRRSRRRRRFYRLQKQR